MRKAYILNVGDELLIGQIDNTNARFLSEKLTETGIEVVEQRVTGDNEAQILDALNDAHRIANIVIITGGLGPTKDDITKNALSEYFDTKLVFNNEVYDRILRIFQQLGVQVTEAHRQQSYLPEIAKLLPNQFGTAPGMMFEKGEILTFSIPGVPNEMKHLMEDQIIPILNKVHNDKVVKSQTLLTVGKGESDISQEIEDIENNLPPHIKLAYLPDLAQVRLRLSGSGPSTEEIEHELNYWKNEIKKILGNVIYGEGNETLASVIQELCVKDQLTVATAESCTGGNVARLLTTNPGSSEFFTGSIIAYSNKIKEKLLSVSEKTLYSKGAVSEETVTEMVSGVLSKMDVDLGIAISGIAGPGGGTPEKPVGTVWLACGDKSRIITKKLQLGKDRMSNIEYSSIMALNLLRHFLIGV